MISIDLLLTRLHCEMAATNVQLSLWKLARAVDRAIKAGYRPDQLRVPAGTSEGGQWASEAEGTARPRTRKPKSSFPPSRHHFVPQSLFNDPQYKLSPETRKVFDDAKTAPLRAAPHYFDEEHRTYNRTVRESFERFLSEKGIRPEQMTPTQAREFLATVMQSRDSRIRGFNWKFLLRESFRSRPPRGID